MALYYRWDYKGGKQIPSVINAELRKSIKKFLKDLGYLVYMKYWYNPDTKIDNALQIKLSKLREWGYLEFGNCKSGTITWSSHGNVTARVGISSNILKDEPYIELNYTASGEEMYLKVRLVRIESNIKGSIWYFLCPVTQKRCRILYCLGNAFLHRKAYKNCHYEKQTYSKKTRRFHELAEKVFGTEKAYDIIYKKHFKKFYGGKPTRTYQKLLKQIELAERLPANTAEWLMTQ